MINYELGFLIAVLCFVYSTILTEENAILNSFYNRMYNVFKTDERASQGKPIHPVFMILIHCSKCVSGQVSFWCFLLLNYSNYNIVLHFFFVSFVIFTNAFIHELYKLIKHTNT